MSADKGGALVRSPPGIVEAYNAHIGGSAKWGDQSAPHITPQKQPQSQRNARVTKHPSGSYKGGYNSSNTESNIKRTGPFEGDSDGDCDCNSWAKARQLEHDLHQLQRTHEAVLGGLHQQLEDMKQKNRDLTFQLLMGPYANAVEVGVPPSPESDVTTPKEHEEQNRPLLEDRYELHKSQKDQPKEDQITDESKTKKHRPATLKGDGGTTSRKSSRENHLNNSKQARSLNLEILEEETDQLSKLLDEERAKNKYLISLVEDLKRQVREETGAWHPPPPNSRRVSQPELYKPNYGSRKSSLPFDRMPPIAFKLPEISSNNQRPRTDHGTNFPQQDISGYASIRKKEGSKVCERLKIMENEGTIFPAIVQQAPDVQQGLPEHSKRESNKKGEYLAAVEQPATYKGKHVKGKSRYRHHPVDHSEESEQGHAPNQYDGRQDQPQKEYRLQKHSQQGISSKDEPENYRDLQHSQKDSDNPKSSVEQRHLKDQEPSSISDEKHQYPTRRRSERRESSPRMRTVSRGKNSETTRSSREGSATGKVTNSPSRKVTGTAGGAVPLESNSPKPSRKVSKKSRNAAVEPSSTPEVNQVDKPMDGTVASSSSSMSSPTSAGVGRTRHRGRANKRGGKKNKKDSQENKEPHDQ